MSEVAASDGAETRFTEALALHEAGRLDEAERLYSAILAGTPAHVPSLAHLAALRLQQGRIEDAVRLAHEVLQRKPDCAPAHAHLGTALYLLSRNDEAIDCYEAALAIEPDAAEAYYGLGLALHALRRFEEAVACHERALVIDADYAEASCALGAALTALKRYDRACESFHRALDVDPDYVEALCGLAEVRQAEAKDDEAIALYGRALALSPDHSPTLIALARALRATGRHHEAIARFRQAVAIDRENADTLVDLGTTLEEMGETVEAVSEFEKAVAIDPADLHAAYALVNARRIIDGDPALSALEAAAGGLDGRSDGERILVLFGLAKALSDLGRHDEAFARLTTANALKREQLVYGEAGTLTTLKRLEAVFTPEFFSRCRGAGARSPRPILIVGMPRSGSTLVEQILASHPDVFGGGERPDFNAAMAGAGLDIAAVDFADMCADLDRDRLGRLGRAYLERLAAGAAAAGRADARRVTDKMLANYCFLGLVCAALPDARIIHIRRDPIDTCLSCYSKLFGTEVPYAYDLRELGRYYRGYAGLMAHWQRVLPPGAMLEIDYEALVDDFEPQARRILAHCGLDWDDACLAFHRTERVVRTASVTQVRQPIYRTSIGRWRPPDAVLQPLLDGLANDPAPG